MRHPATLRLERDVVRILANAPRPLTTRQINEALDPERYGQAYMALLRLEDDGAVTRQPATGGRSPAAHTWQLTDACPRCGHAWRRRAS